MDLQQAMWRARQRRAPRGAAAVDGASVGGLTVALVYRCRNVEVVRELLAPLLSSSAADIRLWGLDGVASDLAPWTIGTGPGGKFALVTQLLDHREVPAEASVAVCDDDVRFVRGGWASMLSLAAEAGLSLCQPTHDRPQNFSHWITVSAPGCRARLTRFVEIGPIFLVAPELVKAVREDMRTAHMGWGLEATWTRHVDRGQRLGMLDDVTVDHLAYPGTAYDNEAAEAELSRRLEGAGLVDFRQLLEVVACWPRREATPPWSVD